MSGQINIQTLFAQLRLEHMLAYLTAQGWQGAAEMQADRVRFELDSSDSNPYVVSLPRSNQSLQCKRLLQAAIYTLCDVEDRQPAEIINDVLKVETTKRSPQSGGQMRLRFSNGDPTHAIALGIDSRPVETLLMPGEAIEIVTESGGEGVREITIRTLSR